MSFARWPLSSVSPLYTLTIGQPENTPGAKICPRKSCTTEHTITATQSKGYTKVKKWSGGVGIKVSEKQEPAQTHSRVIGTHLETALETADSEGYLYLINPKSYPTASCANVRTDEFRPKASWSRKTRTEEKKEWRWLNGMGRRRQSHQACST